MTNGLASPAISEQNSIILRISIATAKSISAIEQTHCPAALFYYENVHETITDHASKKNFLFLIFIVIFSCAGVSIHQDIIF